MRKIYSILVLIIGTTLVAFAQQDPQFSQNMFTKLVNNPGFAGANGAYCGTLLYRNQWTGFGGEPKTTLFTGDAYIDDINSGAGLTVMSDQIGFNKNLNVNASFSYRGFDVGSGKLGVGASVGLAQQSVDGSKFIFNNQGDPSIPTSNVSGSTLDVGAGLYYNDSKMYLGLAADHLNSGKIKYTAGNVSTQVDLVKHYYLQAGYGVDLTPSLELKPSVLVKTDAASTQLDINALLDIDKKYWGGLSYRLQDAIVILAGMEVIPNLKVGYSYDLTLSNIKTYSSGTHEIMIGYCFKPVKVIHRQFHRNVRYL